MDYQSLDVIGTLAGTDKSSPGADYLRHYERIFGGFRHDPILLLEVGVARGSSVEMWSKFFPAASIVGIDNNDGARAYAGGRITIEIGSQADPDFLSVMVGKYQPFIIIDDGSHKSDHIAVTFEYLFPSLAPGGFYVIEDVYLHYGEQAHIFHTPGSPKAVARFAEIASYLTAKHLGPECDDATRNLCKIIDHIEFIPGAIIIQKRRQEDAAKRLAEMCEAVEKTDQHLNWYNFSMILMNHNEFERAEAAATRAVTMSPRNVAYRHRVAALQERRGDIAAAIETMKEARRHDTNDPSVKSKLTALEAKIATT